MACGDNFWLSLSPVAPLPREIVQGIRNRILLESVSGFSKGGMQSHFILIGQGVFRIAEPAKAIGQNRWSVVAPEHHPANDPITLTPFHSLSPPSQTETNA